MRSLALCLMGFSALALSPRKPWGINNRALRMLSLSFRQNCLRVWVMYQSTPSVSRTTVPSPEWA